MSNVEGLPILHDDNPDLIKSVAEKPAEGGSAVGEMFHTRTPQRRKVEPLPLPTFTKMPCPKDWDKGVDLKTPLAELIQPRTDLLATAEEIDKWFRRNYYKMVRPADYVGHEANTDDPALFETSDIRVLVVRLSAYNSVGGSVTHGALAQSVRDTAKANDFTAYTDIAYLPSNGDVATFKKNKIPWLFGRTSRRPPTDFDMILMSIPLTMEIWCVAPALIHSGIAPFKTMRAFDVPLNHARDVKKIVFDPDKVDPVLLEKALKEEGDAPIVLASEMETVKRPFPLIVGGGVTSDSCEVLYGECAGESCLLDAMVVGDGEDTIPAVTKLLNSCKKAGETGEDFLRKGHLLPRPEHFEKDPPEGKSFSWWYEPDLYEHVWEQSEEESHWEECKVERTEDGPVNIIERIPRVGKYKELRSIVRKEGNDHAAEVGFIKRATMRDMSIYRPWEETPLQWVGLGGGSADIQISSGCCSGGLCSFCVAEGTMIALSDAKQVPVETLEDFVYEGEYEDRELDTPFGLQAPEGVIDRGLKECIKLTTARGNSITVTPDHKFPVPQNGVFVDVQAGTLKVDDPVILVQSYSGVIAPRASGARDFLYPPKGSERKLGLDRNGEKEHLDIMRSLRRADAYLDTIVSIENVGPKKVFDVWDIPNGHMFYANGFVVKNCHEGQTQGKWRERPLHQIQEATERAIRFQGAEEASLYSLTWSLHSKIYSLLLWCMNRFGSTNLISQRTDQASADSDFWKFQRAQGEHRATIGIEGISQRMRYYLNKGLSEEQLIRACCNAAESGFSTLKFFQIATGLETEEDVDEYCQMLRVLRAHFVNIAKKIQRTTGIEKSPLRVEPSFMLLLNLPHTPLQWAPCTSSYDLESSTLMKAVRTTQELGFGFKTSLTRDRVRVSQWSGVAGREGTTMLVEVGLRTNYLHYGSIPRRICWLLEKNMEDLGYDWNYYFREKDWDTVFPWDIVGTPQDRAHVWNVWLASREFQGVRYCLKTSVNQNPSCHNCGSCGSAEERKTMLKREVESQAKLLGQEANNRDKTVRKKLRWRVEVKDITLRVVYKDVLARCLSRAFMLAASEKEFDNNLVNSFLRVEGHSLKHAEGMEELPWVMGEVLIDMSFNQNWKDDQMRELLPRINEIINETFPKDKPGVVVHNFTSSDKLSSFDAKNYALYTVDLPFSQYDMVAKLEQFDEAESVKFKVKKTIGKDISRLEEVSKLRSDMIPMAYLKPIRGGVTLSFLCTLQSNPMRMLSLITGKPPARLRPSSITCLGCFRYDREDPDEDDLFAALEDRAVNCALTGSPIETDVFTGEIYKSKTAPDLCLAADLKGLIKMQEHGVTLDAHAVSK